MPAWITSELRELVCVPMAASLSRMTTSRPASARARATARPTTPAPMTTASSLSTSQHPFEGKGEDARDGGDAGHGARSAVERDPEKRAEQRAGSKSDSTDQGRGGARGLGKGRKRHRGG